MEISLPNFVEFIELNENSSSFKNTDLTQRWQHIISRLEIYADDALNPDASLSLQMRDWPNRPSYKRRLSKLKKALGAFNELNKSDTIAVNDKISLVKLLNERINITVQEFELAQLRLLQKRQHIPRVEIEILNKDIVSARKKYGQQLKSLGGIPSAKVSPHLNNFITHEKRKFNFTEKIDFLENVSTGMGIGSRALHFLESMSHALRALGNSLTALPIISAVVSAVPMVLSAVRAWFKNKTPAQKIFATVLAGLAVGAIVSVGLGAAATGGLAAGLVAIGVAKNQIYPWWKLRKEIEKKQAIVDEIRLTDPSSKTHLAASEQQMLLHKLEHGYLMAETLEKRTSIKKSIELIRDGNMETLSSDVNIKTLMKDGDFKEFLITHNNERLQTLNSELKTLKDKEIDSRIGMINGLVGIAGAILVCIPTPPTLILGAALLITNSIVGLALHFELPSKIRSFFRGKQSKTDGAVVVREEGESEKNMNTLNLDNKPPVHQTTSNVMDQLKISPTVIEENHKRKSADAVPVVHPATSVALKAPGGEPPPAREPSNDPVFPLTNETAEETVKHPIPHGKN